MIMGMNWVAFFFILAIRCYSDETYETFLRMADLCEISYCIDGYTIENANDIPSNIEIVSIFEPIVTDFEISGTGFIAVDHTNDKIMVVFKGSSTVGDWINNFNALMIPYIPITSNAPSCEGCSVHSGIYYATKGLIQNQIEPVLCKLVETYPDYQLITTGHSLGGGLTTLAGLEFQMMGYNTTIVSLAGLKIGNGDFCEYLDLAMETDSLLEYISADGDISDVVGYTRIVHEADIVPLIPPGIEYAHGGIEFYINKIDIPHPKNVTLLKGKYEYQPVTTQVLNILSNTQTGKLDTVYEHLNYFFYLSGCNATITDLDILLGMY